MAPTLEEISQYVDHYDAYRELPVEAMSKLFAAARDFALLAVRSESAAEAKKQRSKKEPTPEVQA